MLYLPSILPSLDSWTTSYRWHGHNLPRLRVGFLLVDFLGVMEQRVIIYDSNATNATCVRDIATNISCISASSLIPDPQMLVPFFMTQYNVESKMGHHQSSCCSCLAAGLREFGGSSDQGTTFLRQRGCGLPLLWGILAHLSEVPGFHGIQVWCMVYDGSHMENRWIFFVNTVGKYMVYQMDPMGMLKTSYNYLWTSSRLRSKTSHKLKPEGTVNCLFLNLCQLLTSKLLRFCVSKNWAFEDFKQPPQFSGATPSPSQKEVFRFETFGQRGVNNVNDPHFLVEMIHAHMSLTYVLPSYHKSESFFWIGETRPWRNIILSNSFHFYLFDLPFLFGLSSAKNPADPRDPGRNKPELHTVLWNDFWLLNVSIDSVINWWVDHVPKKNGAGSMNSLLVGWSSLL